MKKRYTKKAYCKLSEGRPLRGRDWRAIRFSLGTPRKALQRLGESANELSEAYANAKRIVEEFCRTTAKAGD